MDPRNRLDGETSPYLRQHRHQPVHWYPWGPEAFAEAHARDVPVLLSVGYSACHWCHVMAHESFDDPEVAEAMNRSFVSVKVDREERPDVDALYMDAVQAMTGRGGWPMTVALTPDGEPFFGGTYFPRARFLQLLEAIDDVWRTRRDELRGQVAALVEAAGRSTLVEPADEVAAVELLGGAVQQLTRAYDTRWGGFGTAPKFPAPTALDLLLRFHAHDDPGTEGATVLRHVVETSLLAMASGGMVDHIGGGFARYSTDERWLVPHFEKMLSDQALLAGVYGRAAVEFGSPVLAQVAAETIEYVLRDLRDPAGGVRSSEDADSAGDDATVHEGRFVTWTVEEVRAATGDLADVALDWYGIAADAARGGTFEGRCIPHRLGHRGDLLRTPEVDEARRRMLAARAARSRPGIDDKVLTEWNALFVSTLADLSALHRRPDWLAAAIEIAEFLVAHLRGPDGRWFRSWHADGEPPARHAALAADHAALVDAFVRLAEASGDPRWLAEAAATADVLLDRFWDPVHGGLFTTADDAEQLVVRQKDLAEGATPSANSLAAIALTRLAALTGERRYDHHADRILRLLAGLIPSSPSSFAVAVAAVDLRWRGVDEIVVTGDRSDLLAVVHERWRPNAVVAWGTPGPGPLWQDRADGFAYVCRDAACRLPAADPETLRRQLAPDRAR
jgi:uncharacterized protein YyaL (SSP411 family)